MKIRIFALAKELGLDNKQLIDFCNEAGIEVKSSALASITEEERQVVMAYMERKTNKGSTATATEEPPAMKRDQSYRTADKVREIPARAPRRRSQHEDDDAYEPEPDVEPTEAVAEPEPEEITPAEAPAPEVVAPPEPPAPVQKPAPEPAPPVVAETAPQPEKPAPAPVVEAAPATPAVKPPEPVQPVPATPAAQTKPAAPAQPGKPVPKEVGKLKRDDYISPTGANRRAPRAMTPISTEATRVTRQDNAAKKTKPAHPAFAAAPEFKAPVKPKKQEEEAPAQQPDMKLSPEVLKGESPLTSHFKRNAEKKTTAEEIKADDAANKSRRKIIRPAEDEGLRAKKPLKGGKRRNRDDDDAGQRRQQRLRKRRSGPVELKSQAVLELPITVRSLSEALGRPAKTLMGILFKQEGLLVTINDSLTEELAELLAADLGVELQIKRVHDVEDDLAELLEMNDQDDDLQPRPPIITVLGHVDHGKTTLVDTIRKANVAAGEAGGITQHIASYQVEKNGHKITFVDTPGHAAFGEMRARGANVTDIVVLVVAADDGVMPQTEECISHARNAKVPIIVALNKMDRPDANEQRVLQELANRDLLPAEWGGDTEVVRTAGLSGMGVDDLLETILLTAELHDYKANPQRPAVGVCLEAFQDEGRGVLAWLIVQNGTLRVGDTMLCGDSFGRVRAIYNDQGQPLQEAPPSTPVKIAGLNHVPSPGEHFFVMTDPEQARLAAEERSARNRNERLASRTTSRPKTITDILAAARAGQVSELPLIIKADTPGSLEALRHELGKFEHPEVKVTIVHQGVGGVNESDVYLASASGASIVAFHVIAEDRAEDLAMKEGVEIRRFSIIYEVTDKIKNELEGLLAPETREVPTGRAIVLRTFDISRVGRAAGCRVLNGTIERNNKLHVIRDQRVLNSYGIASLRREKDDVREVREGMECGIRLDGFNDVKEGDLLESYRIEQVKRTLDS